MTLLRVNLTGFGSRRCTRPERKHLDNKQTEPLCFDMPQFRLAASPVSTPPTPPVAATIRPFTPLFLPHGKWCIPRSSVALATAPKLSDPATSLSLSQ